jgi:hypothetical protein
MLRAVRGAATLPDCVGFRRDDGEHFGPAEELEDLPMPCRQAAQHQPDAALVHALANVQPATIERRANRVDQPQVGDERSKLSANRRRLLPSHTGLGAGFAAN